MSHKKEPLEKKCHCGVTFYVKPSLERVKSCSVSCGRKLVKPYERTEKHKKRIGDLNRKPKIEKCCLACKKTFFVKPSMARQNHCSISCGKKWKPSWNKGIPLSEPTKAKLKESLKGRSTWNKGIAYMAIRGENHPNWKGGVTDANMKARHSLEYKEWRKAVYQRDDYTCVECKERGVKLNADHIKQFAFYPELRFDIGNGRTLCVPCHRNTDTFACNVDKRLL